MDFPQRAVFFLEEDSSLPAHSKPADAGSRVILPDPKMDE